MSEPQFQLSLDELAFLIDAVNAVRGNKAALVFKGRLIAKLAALLPDEPAPAEKAAE